MGVPAVKKMLIEHPGPNGYPIECVIEALQLCLTCNGGRYTTGDGVTHYIKPIRGTAMGPCHACDYCDVFMGELDEKLIKTCKVPLISSLLPKDSQLIDENLDFTRFRDDGISILLHEKDTHKFEQCLQNLHPDIKWEVQPGTEKDYLDVHLMLKNGEIHSDVFSKSSHNYLPPNSCHPRSTFKGLISSVGTRLRIICSHDKYLAPRIEEYARYFAACGWNYDKARGELIKGSNYDKKDTEEEACKKREHMLYRARSKKTKKIAWITTYDPRVPQKSKIIHKHMHILYRNPQNKKCFPEGLLIGADKKRKNLRQIIKPTVPRRFVQHGPFLENGCFPCAGAMKIPGATGACDLCKHIKTTHSFISPYDNRKWNIRQHLTCSTPNLIYLIICKCNNHESYAWYIGSTNNILDRWRNHRKDFKSRRYASCGLSRHAVEPHPEILPRKPIEYLKVILLETLGKTATEAQLINREVWWQSNVGTLFFGLNKRKDFRTAGIQRNRTYFGDS